MPSITNMLSISQCPSKRSSSAIPDQARLRNVPSVSHSLGISLNTYIAHHHPFFDEFGQPTARPLSFSIQPSNASDSILEPLNEMQQYGYNGIYTNLRLDLSTIAEIVPLIARQFKSRPIDSPLLFSSHALDISVDGVHSLIRNFIKQPQNFLRGQYFFFFKFHLINPLAFVCRKLIPLVNLEYWLSITDLQVSSLHDLSSFLKWIIARYVDGHGKRGFLEWDTYATWRKAEKGE